MNRYDFEWRILELLNKSSHTSDTMRIFLEELSKEFKAVAASIWLLDEKDNICLYAACGENCGGLERIVLERGQGICGACIEKNDVVYVEDVAKDRRWERKADEVTGFHTESILAVPISAAQTGAFGCLQLLNKKDGSFNAEEISLARTMSALLAKWFFESDVRIPALKKNEVLLEGIHLTKTYGEGEACVYALNDVSFRINKGELTVILGSSGCGKSTLLNIIGGMTKPNEGNVIFHGLGDVAGFNKKKQTIFRKDSVGFIFQFYNLLPELTVWENIALAADMAESPRQIEEVLETMCLSHKRNYYPSQLSGGEQQRVSIARALVKNAAFLLCDEPTGALDYNTGKQILIELEKLVREKGQTVVIVTHTTAISNIADRILKMQSGRIVEEIVNPNPVSAAMVEW